MSRSKLAVDWRERVNPLFVLAIQFMRVIPLVLRQLVRDRANGEAQVWTVLVEGCEETLPLLPRGLPEKQDSTQDLIECLTREGENKWLANPEIRRVVAEIGARVQTAPEPLLKKGFDRPHWWMAQESWSEALQKERMVVSGLNALALLHFQIPLRVLKHRVASGDADLFGKLFRFDNKILQSQPTSLNNILEEISDEATKIIGNALLLRGEPARHQMGLRLVLFFGWDFGLGDLSNDQLYSFLRDIRMIPSSYDPESLRRYRNRLRRLIRRAPQRLLPNASSTASQ